MGRARVKRAAGEHRTGHMAVLGEDERASVPSMRK
jgi:hypothetical protein